MRPITGLLLLSLLAFSQTVTEAAGTETIITGYPPFALGTDRSATLASTPGLVPGVLIVNDPIVPYLGFIATTVRMGTQSRTINADLSLGFHQDKLAVIRIDWSAAQLRDVLGFDRSGEAYADMRNRLLNTYHPSLVKEDRTYLLSPVGTMELKDTEGNIVWLKPDLQRRPNSLYLAYVWAPYAKGRTW